MNIMTGILVFVIAWWLVFFMLLPVGVRSHTEDGADVLLGTVESAPTNPRLWWKAGGATAAATIIWLAFFLIDRYDLITMR